MIKVINRSGANAFGLKGALWEFTCTESADIANLPTSKTEELPYGMYGVRVGSTCICTEATKVAKYMLGADGEWHIIEKLDYVEEKTFIATIEFSNFDYIAGYESTGTACSLIEYSIDGGNSWNYLDSGEKKIECSRIRFKMNDYPPYSPYMEENGESIDGDTDYVLTSDRSFSVYYYEM